MPTKVGLTHDPLLNRVSPLCLAPGRFFIDAYLFGYFANSSVHISSQCASFGCLLQLVRLLSLLERASVASYSCYTCCLKQCEPSAAVKRTKTYLDEITCGANISWLQFYHVMLLPIFFPPYFHSFHG